MPAVAYAATFQNDAVIPDQSRTSALGDDWIRLLAQHGAILNVQIICSLRLGKGRICGAAMQNVDLQESQPRQTPPKRVDRSPCAGARSLVFRRDRHGSCPAPGGPASATSSCWRTIQKSTLRRVTRNRISRLTPSSEGPRMPSGTPSSASDWFLSGCTMGLA